MSILSIFISFILLLGVLGIVIWGGKRLLGCNSFKYLFLIYMQFFLLVLSMSYFKICLLVLESWVLFFMVFSSSFNQDQLVYFTFYFLIFLISFIILGGILGLWNLVLNYLAFFIMCKQLLAFCGASFLMFLNKVSWGLVLALVMGSEYLTILSYLCLSVSSELVVYVLFSSKLGALMIFVWSFSLLVLSVSVGYNSGAEFGFCFICFSNILLVLTSMVGDSMFWITFFMDLMVLLIFSLYWVGCGALTGSNPSLDYTVYSFFQFSLMSFFGSMPPFPQFFTEVLYMVVHIMSFNYFFFISLIVSMYFFLFLYLFNLFKSLTSYCSEGSQETIPALLFPSYGGEVLFLMSYGGLFFYFSQGFM